MMIILIKMITTINEEDDREIIEDKSIIKDKIGQIKH